VLVEQSQSVEFVVDDVIAGPAVFDPQGAGCEDIAAARLDVDAGVAGQSLVLVRRMDGG